MTEKPDVNQDQGWYYLRGVISRCHETAKRKGWWEKYKYLSRTSSDFQELLPDIIGSKLCLAHSELSEALEEVRNGRGPKEVYFSHTLMDEGGVRYTSEEKTMKVERPDGSVAYLKPEGFGVELADAVIRIFDLAGWLGIDLAELIRLKMEFNETRSHKHGGKAI